MNDFLVHDAKDYLKQRMAVTYLLEKDGRTAAFFCVSNDKIEIDKFERPKSLKNIKFQFKVSQQNISSFPAVKLWRLGVDAVMQAQGIGTIILNFLKNFFVTDNKSGCMFSDGRRI